MKNLNNKIEFNKKRNTAKWILALMITMAVMLLLACAVYGIVTFCNNYGFQSPLTFRSPIYSKQKDVLITPMATHSAKQTSVIDLSKIADKIFQLESGKGAHVNCPEGTYNGYGFRQNTFEWVCYPTQEEVRQHVINWLSQNIKNGDVESALCYYNQGTRNTKGCTYTVNYASL